ncbi:MAG: hypothetical protein ISS13_02770 [Actinobacteria bacterium]|nr:hypothetical protein [Actinomycetota bacterium]
MKKDEYKKKAEDFIEEIETIRELNHKDARFEDFELRVEKYLEEMAIQGISQELRNFKMITFFRPIIHSKYLTSSSANDLETYKKSLDRLELLLKRVIDDINICNDNEQDYSDRIGF